MTRTVLLPRELERKLDKLAELDEETNGALFYRQEDTYCQLEQIFLTGVGDEGNVQASAERVMVVDKFLERNPDYGFVKFHVHSAGTIKRYGEKYAQEFSAGDLDGYKRHFKEDPRFIAMLVTPEIKLLCGIDNPVLKVVESFPGYLNRSRAVKEVLERIKRELGAE